MKLGYSAWGMPMLPVDEQIRAVADIGYTGIELICIERSSTDLEKLDSTERRRIRSLLDAAGLDLPALHASVNPIDPDPAIAARNIDRLRRSIDLATDIARGTPPAIVLMGYGKPETYETDRERLVEIFRGLAEYGRQRDVTLALELHVGQAIDRPERTRWLLDAIDHPNFKLNLDASHLDVMGYSIPDSVRPLVADAVHTHVKDQRGRYPQHEYLTPGDGDYDYVQFLQEMANGGYQGYITGEISIMVQRKPGYDPIATAQKTYATLSKAFERASLPIER